MQYKEFKTIVNTIFQEDPRYKEDAYEFVMEAFSYVKKKFKLVRHVSAEALLEGISDLLMAKFGPMAITVLKYWGIENTEDFGHIVFNLVNNNILRKSHEDSLENFRNTYNFEEVFNCSYRKKLHKKISRMRSF